MISDPAVPSTARFSNARAFYGGYSLDDVTWVRHMKREIITPLKLINLFHEIVIFEQNPGEY
jgi:hypothetical protein